MIIQIICKILGGQVSVIANKRLQILAAQWSCLFPNACVFEFPPGRPPISQVLLGRLLSAGFVLQSTGRKHGGFLENGQSGSSV